MNPRCRALLLLWLLAISVGLRAQPENFLVGDYQFVRPPKWIWIEEKKNHPAALIITNAATRQSAEVVFMHFKAGESFGSRDSTFYRWRNYFEKEGRVETRDVKKFGTNEVLFAEVTGTHRQTIGKAINLRPKHALLGAHIVHPKGNVAARIIGPNAVVQKSKAEFQKMIESAVASD